MQQQRLPMSDEKPRHIVGLSGGKDSTALALLLVEREPNDYEFICNMTGNELPEMFEHWEKLEVLLKAKIKPVRYHIDLIGASLEQGMLPNVFRRWCTRLLKIEPTIKYFSELPENSVLYVGLRADEEVRRGLYGEDISVRFPLRDWGFNESGVYSYLEARGVQIPERTDCGICPYQRLGEWRNLYFQHPKIYAEGVDLEKKTGFTIRSPGRDTWPAALADLAVEFDSGRVLREYDNKKKCRVCSL